MSMALQADARLGVGLQPWIGPDTDVSTRFQVRALRSRDSASGIWESRWALELDSTLCRVCQKDLLGPAVFTRVNFKQMSRLDQGARATLNGNGYAGSALPPGGEDHFMLRAVELAGSSCGLTAPHPNAGCVVVQSGQVVGEGFLYAQGTTSAEVQALEQAGERARGAVVYLNLEPGDCHGDNSAVEALCESGVARVVVGLRHPLPHLEGRAMAALAQAGVQVEVVGEEEEEVLRSCRQVNTPLLFRSVHHLPFSVLKYAMTLDGKIATTTGHAAWVTSPAARQRVFETRSCSDAIIVGGNTVRRDDPRLTTRRDSGHVPVRIVMSRTLRLPEDAVLWDVTSAPTIVMTQRGAREDFQKMLRGRGVDVVEFDFLTPAAVARYCYDRGFLQILWECGGTLSAPAIAAGVIHKVLAFVAPKLIGGVSAPSPVGELGFVEMTQALPLQSVQFQQVGPDMLVTGYLHPLPEPRPAAWGASVPVAPTLPFYKAWDPYGALSNFSPHPIVMDGTEWASVEHYYQAHKFVDDGNEDVREAVEGIRNARSPEEAARKGRRVERSRGDLVRKEWNEEKLRVMERALRQKFATHPGLRSLLLSTRGKNLVEASPHDYFWGCGRNRSGQNHLGRLLMRVRADLAVDHDGTQKEESAAKGQAPASCV